MNKLTNEIFLLWWFNAYLLKIEVLVFWFLQDTRNLKLQNDCTFSDYLPEVHLFTRQL